VLAGALGWFGNAVDGIVVWWFGGWFGVRWMLTLANIEDEYLESRHALAPGFSVDDLTAWTRTRTCYSIYSCQDGVAGALCATHTHAPSHLPCENRHPAS
jgi:hypothetical protein